MKTILIPTDFSGYARNAARYAVHLFGKEEDVKYVLINTYSLSDQSTEIIVSSLKSSMGDDARKKLKEEMDYLVEETGIKRKNLACFAFLGDVINTIRDFAKSHEIDYIVMGTKGASGLKKVLIGSNTYHLIQNVKLPVIAVPRKSGRKPPANIVLAAKMDTHIDREKYAPVMEIVKKHNAKITFLTVKEPHTERSTDEFRDEIKETFRDVNHSFTFLNDKNVSESIERYLRLEDVDMLVLLPRKTTFFDRLFDRSVTRKISFHTDTPLLALP